MLHTISEFGFKKKKEHLCYLTLPLLDLEGYLTIAFPSHSVGCMGLELPGYVIGVVEGLSWLDIPALESFELLSPQA